MAGNIITIPLVLEEIKEGKLIFSFNTPALDSAFSKSNSSLYVIGIAGSQSTGKSTLLNKAFGFYFKTMDSTNAGQTTRGIDISISDRLGYVCLDIEGGDSAERDEEDNSYMQRMVSAYGLVVSNLLIYNIFLKDIRTVREVNALANMMTHYLRVCKDKRKILFCFRDVITMIEQISGQKSLRLLIRR
jgi:GTPase Era involved in 16S rRNA processing